jgi:hypothetical protein
MSDLEHLYAVQALDTSADQLRYQRAHLPERTALAEARRAQAAAKAALGAAEARQGALETRYGVLETEATDRAGRKARLDAKLRTIVITREAEAVQRELAMLAAEQDVADEEALAVLEDLERLGNEIDGLRALLAASSDVERIAAEVLIVAEADVDARLGDTVARRGDAVVAVPAALMARYEQMLPRFKGVAVARLQGPQCTGCHMDLSRVELEAVWATPEGTLPECPQCARLLVK